MEKVTLPEMSRGEWRVEHFKTDRTDYHALLHGRIVPTGETYTRLMRGNTLVMSDTPAEMEDHWEPLREAHGSCLINGLGLGMFLKNVLLKDNVTDVTVVEISQDLIDLISPFYTDLRITFVCDDAFNYVPQKGKKYGMVWHDIFDNICSDNLDGMKKLHRKYCRRCRWQGSWCREECERGR